MRRIFTFLPRQAGSRRGFDFYPPRVVTTNMRIRPLVIFMFRKWFGGLEPTFHWHEDGFMAEAWDKRGNHMQVEQVNHYHRFNPGATQMRRPLCPMVIKAAMEAKN